VVADSDKDPGPIPGRQPFIASRCSCKGHLAHGPIARVTLSSPFQLSRSGLRFRCSTLASDERCFVLGGAR
jgi:hypothetical protein